MSVCLSRTANSLVKGRMLGSRPLQHQAREIGGAYNKHERHGLRMGNLVTNMWEDKFWKTLL